MSLYRETPCEHGEIVFHTWDHTITPIEFLDDACPGGTREEVTPNIQAAWHWAIKRQAMSREFVAGIVAAALTPGDE